MNQAIIIMNSSISNITIVTFILLCHTCVATDTRTLTIYTTPCCIIMQPGIAYSVAYKGKVLKAGGLGVKAKGSTDAPDSNTIFRVGSVSKVFPVSKTY